MNTISDSFFFAHAFEFRLLLALIIVPVTFAAIQFTSLVARMAGSIVAKANRNRESTAGAFSAVGAR